MEAIQDWAAYLLSNNPTAYSTIMSYTPYLSQLYAALTFARVYITTLLTQLTKSPDLATIALLLIIFFVSLKILDILWQSFLFWFRLMRKLVFWGGLAVLGVWMYTRGLEGMVEDVGYWGAVWREEYGVWKERERVARMGGNARGWGGGGNGGGYGNGGQRGWF